MTQSFQIICLLCCLALGVSTQAQDKPQVSPILKPSLTVTVVSPQIGNMAQKVSANGNWLA